MKNRSSHVGKSMEEKQIYQRYIEASLPDPTTADESIKFHPSNEIGEELARPTETGVRQPPFKIKATDYIAKHWFGWLIALVLIILTFLVYDARVNIAVFDTKINFQQQQLEKFESNIDNKFDDEKNQNNLINLSLEKINESIFNIRLKTSELIIRLDFLEQLLDK